jgi:hypothetical protein
MRYSNVKTWVQGIKFDSRLESKRFIILKNRESAGLIEDLKVQVSFNLCLPEEDKDTFPDEYKRWRNRKYFADFTYVRDGNIVVEDVKSSYTACDEIFREKKERMLSMGIYVKEVLPEHIPFLDLPTSLKYKQYQKYKRMRYKKQCRKK